MSVSLFVKNKVKDFDTWKKLYDEGGPMIREKHGVIADSIHRQLDDPNTIIVYHKFESEENLKMHLAAMKSDEFLEGPVKMGGVILETMEVWTGVDV